MPFKIPPLINFPPNMMTLIVWKGFIPLTLHFPIMPESFMVLKKYLVTVINTEGGGFVNDYGEAPHPLTIAGTFGYNTKGYFGKKLYSGFGWVKYLEWLVDESHIPDRHGEMPTVHLMSWASQHYVRVLLNEINISQSVNRNMLWTYNLKMVILGNISNDNPFVDAAMIAISNTIVKEGAKISEMVRLRI